MRVVSLRRVLCINKGNLEQFPSLKAVQWFKRRWSLKYLWYPRVCARPWFMSLVRRTGWKIGSGCVLRERFLSRVWYSFIVPKNAWNTLLYGLMAITFRINYGLMNHTPVLGAISNWRGVWFLSYFLFKLKNTFYLRGSIKLITWPSKRLLQN